MEPTQNTNQLNNLPPKRQPRKILAALLFSLSGLVVVGLLIAGLILQQNNTNKINTQVKKLENRISSLEKQDEYPATQVNRNLYQAVFLSNDQTYFAKITKITKDTIKIDDIYYLKTGNVDRNGNPTSSGEVSLTKLGNELHGPQDTMIVERKNVLFWENLKTDGKVSQAIIQHKKANP